MNETTQPAVTGQAEPSVRPRAPHVDAVMKHVYRVIGAGTQWTHEHIAAIEAELWQVLETTSPAVAGHAEPSVRPCVPAGPVAWADELAIAGRIGNCETTATKRHWERGSEIDKARAATMRHPLYTAQQLDAALEADRLAAWEAVNSRIQHGDIGGDGRDKTAERNGLILAANVLMQRIHGPNGAGIACRQASR